MPNDLTTALSNFLGTLMGGRPAFGVGAGSAEAKVTGVLTVSTTQAGTAADTNETDLWTYSLPANTLNVDGKGIRITAWGTTGATANNKTMKLYFAGTVLNVTLALAANNRGWILRGQVIRTGAATQIATGELWVSDQTGRGGEFTAPTGDTTGAITIKMTGTNGTAAANDIVFRGATVEVLN